jgi:uncharacterized membrane protein
MIMTIDNKFDQEIFDKIKGKKIAPIPKWQFLFRNYVVWAFGLFSLILGAIAVSLILFMSSHDNLDFYRRAGGQPLEFLFLVIPIFWIVCLAVFIALVYYNIKHTRKGYRYSPAVIFLVVVGISVFLGGIFHILGLGEPIDDILGRRAPFYDRIINPRMHFWSNPETGRLMGLILAQTEEGKYTLVDQNRQEWSVLTAGVKMDGEAEMKIGQPARLFGETITDHTFKAAEILPFGPGREFMNRFRPGEMPLLPEMSQEGFFRPGEMMGCRAGTTTFSDLLTTHPEFREAFMAGMLGQKDKLGELIKKDPKILKDLESLGIAPEVIGQISGE